MKRIRIALEERFLIEVSKHLSKKDFELSFKILAKTFLHEILLCLEANDILYERRDKEIFTALYIEKANITTLSVERACKECILCEATLFRYRQNYIKLINFFIEKYSIITITIKN